MSEQRGRSSNPPYGWLPWTAPAPGGEVEHAKPGRCHECHCTLSKYRSRIRIMKDGKLEPEYCWPCADRIRREDGVDVGPFVAEPELEPEPVSSAEAARQAVTETRRRLTREEKAANRKYKLCTCGRDYHKKGTIGCHACRCERRRAPIGSPPSRVCKCGGPKKHGALLCRTCHWRARDAAWTPRPKGKAA